MNLVGCHIRYCVDILWRFGMAEMRRQLIHLYTIQIQCVLSQKCDKNVIAVGSRRYTVSKREKHSRYMFHSQIYYV